MATDLAPHRPAAGRANNRALPTEARPWQELLPQANGSDIEIRPNNPPTKDQQGQLGQRQGPKAKWNGLSARMTMDSKHQRTLKKLMNGAFKSMVLMSVRNHFILPISNSFCCASFLGNTDFNDFSSDTTF
jgi:hypothetical protein